MGRIPSPLSHSIASRAPSAAAAKPAPSTTAKPAASTHSNMLSNEKNQFDKTPSTVSSGDVSHLSPFQSAAAKIIANVKKGLSNRVSTQSSHSISSAEQKKIDAQYDSLQQTVVTQSGGHENAWKTGEGELNLIGVRSMQNGQLNDGAADKYNDTIYACRIKNGKKEVYAFDSTVDAGKWNDQDLEESGFGVHDSKGHLMGVSHLADGFYEDAFKKGPVSGGVEGLRQSGWLRMHLDTNGDGIIADNEKLGDGLGRAAGTAMKFQFHPGFGDTVGTTSAGCQVIRGEQWGKFNELLNDAPASQKKFSYALVDGHDYVAQRDAAPPKVLTPLEKLQQSVRFGGHGRFGAKGGWSADALKEMQAATAQKARLAEQDRLNGYNRGDINITEWGEGGQPWGRRGSYDHSADGRGMVTNQFSAALARIVSPSFLRKQDARVNFLGSDDGGIGRVIQPYGSFAALLQFNPQFIRSWPRY